MWKTYVLITIVGCIIGGVLASVENARDAQAGTVVGQLNAVDRVVSSVNVRTVSLVRAGDLMGINLSCDRLHHRCDCNPRVERCPEE